MSETAAPRKLATIVALDVAGYSARTEADEAKTTADVAKLRKIIKTIAKAHGGRIFNTAGDGFMLEFGSSVSAVEAALELAETCEPKVRVGVHLGDVVVQPNGDLLGHGVNVAARLMAQSTPGSALISADVRRTIRGPLADKLQSRGHLKLDKMSETIEAFALVALASAILATPSPTAEPVLAVLPFDNLSNDPEMQFISDGISEEIIRVLMSGGHLKVIGRTSAFHFRGTFKAQAARTLNATHVLDGSVRKSGTRVRINAQLTEGSGGAGLWAHRYDEDLSDIFSLQDDVAAKVSAALKLVFEPARRGSIDSATYEMYLRASKLTWNITTDDARQAIPLLEQVVARAPGFALAWGMLANARSILMPRDEDGIGTPAHRAALEAAEQACALDPKGGLGYRVLALLKPAFGEHAEKIRLLQQAYQLEANSPGSHTSLGGAFMSVGRVKEACDCLLRAYALDPMLPFISSMASSTLIAVGRVSAGLQLSAEAMARQPDSLWLRVTHFYNLYNSGDLDKASAYLKRELEARTDVPADLLTQPRNLLLLSEMNSAQRENVFRNLMDPMQDPVLRLPICGLAARNGLVDLVYDHLFSALDCSRPIGGVAGAQIGINRAFLGAVFFTPLTRALRCDPRFARLCASLGFVDYWRNSGHWPDCADDVPYDFRAECERAVDHARVSQ